MKTKKITKKGLTVGALIAAYTILLFPFIATIFYSVPSADDFSMAACLPYPSLFLSAIDRANYLYRVNGGGIWIAKFFEVLLSPLATFEIDSMAYGITMIIFFLLLMISINVFWRKILHYEFQMEKGIGREILVFLCMAVPLLGFTYPEVFYWFSGAPYGWFFGLTLLTYGFVLEYCHKNNRKRFLLLILAGTISSMNIPYVVPVILFYIAMMLKYRRKELFSVKGIVPILFFIGGALVYLLSPGVHARQSNLGGSVSLLSIFNAGILTIKGSVSRGGSLLVNCPFPFVVLLLVFFMGIWNKGTVRKKLWPAFFTLFVGILTVMGSLYPVMLGYGVCEMPNRVCFTFDFLLYVTLILFAFQLGQGVAFLCSFDWDIGRWVIVMTLFAFCIYSSLIVSGTYKKAGWSRTLAKMPEVKVEHEDRIGMLKEIESADGEDVLVKSNGAEITGILMEPKMWEDESWWVNGAVARFFGKKTVRIEW